LQEQKKQMSICEDDYFLYDEPEIESDEEEEMQEDEMEE